MGALELELLAELDETLDEKTEDEDWGLLDELLEAFVLEDDFCSLDEEVFISIMFGNLMTVLEERE